MYLHFNVGSYLSILCRWFPILRCWIDSGIICCLINSEPFPPKSVEKEPLVFSMLASCRSEGSQRNVLLTLQEGPFHIFSASPAVIHGNAEYLIQYGFQTVI